MLVTLDLKLSTSIWTLTKTRLAEMPVAQQKTAIRDLFHVFLIARHLIAASLFGVFRYPAQDLKMNS